MPTGSFLRPNTVKVERRGTGPIGPDGTPDHSPSTIYTTLNCLIDPVPTGELRYADPAGAFIAQSDVLFADGLMPSRIPTGTLPGQSFTLNGVLYVVAMNGRGAFPDIRQYDRITREDGAMFLVLVADRYSDVAPLLEARLAYGKSW